MTSGSSSGGSPEPGDCERCQQLPNVRTDALVDCVAGMCVYEAASCEEGFAHCRGDFSEVGCEADVGDPARCGSCEHACEANQVCLVPAGYVCSTCSFPRPTACGNTCADLQNDSAHCGACGAACADTEVCRQGSCVGCLSSLANCDGENVCDDSLVSSSHCGACGVECSTLSTTGACTPDNECEVLACRAGFADCDASGNDCEAKLDQAECGPRLSRFFPISDAVSWLALDADGSMLTEADGVIQRRSPMGTLQWSYALAAGREVSQALIVDDGVVVSGTQVLNASGDSSDIGMFVLKLSSAGELAWQRVLLPQSGAGQAVSGPMAVNRAGSVLFSARLSGTVDVDPTDGVDLETYDFSQFWLFQLDATGTLSWARPLGDSACGLQLEAVAQGPGSTAVAGYVSDDCVLDGAVSPPASFGGAFLAVLSGAGITEEVVWLRAPGTSADVQMLEHDGLVVYDDGSVALVGVLSSALYLDDATEPVARAESPRGFAARFSDDLALMWVKTAPQLHSPAAAPDGGLLAALAFEQGFAKHQLTLWREDGSAAWSAEPGCHNVWKLASDATSFAVATEYGTDGGARACDLEPGPRVVNTVESRLVAVYDF